MGDSGAEHMVPARGAQPPAVRRCLDVRRFGFRALQSLGAAPAEQRFVRYRVAARRKLTRFAALFRLTPRRVGMRGSHEICGMSYRMSRFFHVPTSYMAYRSDYNFIGEYDYGKQAGLLHVADHHIAPGKKQWTWGCGEFGKAWDLALTDEDGPYHTENRAEEAYYRNDQHT